MYVKIKLPPILNFAPFSVQKRPDPPTWQGPYLQRILQNQLIFHATKKSQKFVQYQQKYKEKP